ncbi:TRAP transporter small permease subunit [Dissulfurirhabdus thermomarina]|uniref:TRAP transporter small permease subunit n=1 Tax=Dissulfurirhabdus thermomarina TaxID=1765737 RepID=A0A6N9TL15_DISTH|nr:TRAP transporter small permease subunit [Dissulfurirhabdus thermomarina]NDY41925.1 TRAP transporter small permease subunit [Dissulfurirhabdus thermomarina]NMX23111.1 TRAP transporter small permease subunit [Dissulfurirhabdus thermomarina]
MTRLPEKIARAADALNDAVGRAASWLSLALVVLVTVDVALRYLFRVSFVAAQELEWHLFAVLFLLGAGYTLRHDAHVRVDVFYQRFGPRTRALVNLLGCLFFLFPGCFLVIKTSWPFVAASWRALEGSPDPGGLPYRFALKAMIPLAFVLLALQGVSLAVRSAAALAGRRAGEPEEPR